MNALTKVLNFFRATSSTSSSAKRPSVRLGVESLEDRMMPSASSFNLHAIHQATGGSAAFYRSPANDAFYEKTPAGSIVKLSDAHTVTDFSAGLDHEGHADLFAHRYGALAMHDNVGWHWLNEPRTMLHFAAVNGGRLYAEADNNTMWQYTAAYNRMILNPITHRMQSVTWPAHWNQLSGLVWGLDAITDSSNVDTVFAIDANSRLQRYSQGTWSGPIDMGTGLNGFSAGLNYFGEACVYTVDSDGYMDRIETNWPIEYLGKANPQDMTIRGTSNGQAFAYTYSQLYQYDDAHGFVTVPGSDGIGHITDVSAAGADDVFVITAGGHLKEHTAAGWFSYN